MDEQKKHSSAANRRQRQIEDCLYSSLRHRPYPSVSVSDLCQQLNISRKSFYNYFQDKESCFRSIIYRKIRECILHLTVTSQENVSEEEYIRMFLSFWKEQRTFLDIVVRNNLLYLLIDTSVAYIRDEDGDTAKLLNTPQLKADHYVLTSYVMVHITIVLKWYHRGFEESVEEMVEKYRRLIYRPLINREEIP